MATRPKGVCGRTRADGQPCQNPPGCSINHKRVNRAAEAAVRIAAAASADALRLGQMPDEMRASVIDPLAGADMLYTPSPGTQYVTAAQLMADAEAKGLLEGFTLGPASIGDKPLDEPPHGSHCVALYGSDMKLPHDPALQSGGRPSDPTIDALVTYLGFMEPAYASGNAWIGGFPWDSGPYDGCFEVNVTVVFKPEYREEAEACGRLWNQESMWTVDHSRPPGEPRGHLTPLGGTGEGSPLLGADMLPRPDRPSRSPTDPTHPARRGRTSRFMRRRQ